MYKYPRNSWICKARIQNLFRVEFEFKLKLKLQARAFSSIEKSSSSSQVFEFRATRRSTTMDTVFLINLIEPAWYTKLA